MFTAMAINFVYRKSDVQKGEKNVEEKPMKFSDLNLA